MTQQASKILEIFALVGTISCLVYYGICLWSAIRFLIDRRTRSGPSFLPPVSILKPLKGIDPEIYQSFRSHCEQDYPDYEIIFGVTDLKDPAVESVHRLQREFPSRCIQLVVCKQNLGTNTKISNLAQMMSASRYGHLVVNDSDIVSNEIICLASWRRSAVQTSEWLRAFTAGYQKNLLGRAWNPSGSVRTLQLPY